MMRTWVRLRRLVVGLVFASAMLAQSSRVLADEPWRWWSHASAYGQESIHDGGYWSNEEWRWIGYYNQRTSWGWHCARPEDLRPDSPFYTWAIITPDSYGVAHRDPYLLGTWIEMEIPRVDGSTALVTMPVTDAGPYGVWWHWDIQDGVIRSLGWGGVSPSRYGESDGPYYGRRDVRVRTAPEHGRFCPRWGYTEELSLDNVYGKTHTLSVG